MSWWESFFDADYLALWGGLLSPERSAAEAEGLWALAGLAEGSRVLDAPCGQGRLSMALARRGARVLGVDQSAALLERAEADRGDLPVRFLRHDLRAPLAEGDFDAAINVFSSLGYGSEDDDRAILATLAAAVRPRGRVVVETMHRDLLAARLGRGHTRIGDRLPDGTLVVETPSFDPVTGRMDTAWHWSGPRGAGVKRGSVRVYAITELVRLLEGAGLRFVSAHRGCTTEPFRADGPDVGGRVALVAER